MREQTAAALTCDGLAESRDAASSLSESLIIIIIIIIIVISSSSSSSSSSSRESEFGPGRISRLADVPFLGCHAVDAISVLALLLLSL